MERGWTRLWRKTWDNPVLKERGKRFSRMEAWLHIVNVLARGVDDPDAGLRRGEFEASVRYLAKAWNWGVSSVYRFMIELQAESMIARVEHFSEHPAEHKAEHFIVCNYEAYNECGNGERNTPWNTSRNKVKKEGKNVERTEKDMPAGAGPIDRLPSVESFQLSERLRTAIARRDPHSRAAKLPDLTHWARDIDKIIRVDGRRAEDCEAVIDWCQKSPFWGPNILSGRKLREKFDQLYGQMKADGGNSRGTEADADWILDTGREYGAKRGG
jgi:hypothetical protein